MSPEMVAAAQEEFVRARQGEGEGEGEGGSSSSDRGLTPADFHRWLTVVRLATLSLGDPLISSEHWAHMRALERARAERG